METALALVNRLNSVLNSVPLSLTLQSGLPLGTLLQRLVQSPIEKSLYMLADDDDYFIASKAVDTIDDGNAANVDAETIATFSSPALWTITTGKMPGSASRNVVATFTRDSATPALTGFGIIIEGIDQFGVVRSILNGNSEVLGGTLPAGVIVPDNFTLDTFAAALLKVQTGSIAWRTISRIYIKAIAAGTTIDVSADTVKLGFGDSHGAGVILGAQADVQAVSTAGGAPLTVTVNTTYNTINYNWTAAQYDFLIDSTKAVLPTS
jgi:hypothetical protein